MTFDKYAHDCTPICIIKSLTLILCFLFTLWPCFSYGQKLSKLFKLYAAHEYRIPPPAEVKFDLSKSYLIKFNSVPRPHLIERVEVLKIIDSQHYIVMLKDDISNFKSQIEYLVPSNNNWKATTRLLRQVNSMRQKDSVLIKAQITLPINKHNLAIGIGSVKEVLSDYGAVIIKIKRADWDSFLNETNVQFVDMLIAPKEEVQISNLNLSLNKILALNSASPDLKGEGITVSIKENLFDTTDVDIRGRFVQTPLASSAITNHATVMATIIGGNGNSYGGKSGIATKALLSSSDFKHLVPDNIQYFEKYKISVQNHSYGTGIENYYGIEAAAYDKLSIEVDTLIHVFSSGNIGNNTPTDGMYSGIKDMANLSGTFKQAKNVLVIGGTDNLGHVEPLSSRGPAYDGRIKPELVAFGIDGTSGASAIVSGTSTLLIELYQRLYKRKPSSAMLRAIMINSANDVPPHHVDYTSGFGSLNALRAASIVNENTFFDGILSDGSQTQVSIDVPDNTQELKVTLVWNDPPAGINAPKALINNLDLSVKKSDGQEYLPWVLNSYPHRDSLSLEPIRALDDINTVEQVTIDNPQPGQYTINIKGRGPLTQHQPFSVAYKMREKGTFKWTYPNRNDQLRAGDFAIINWDTSMSGEGTLSFSVDGGNTWREIDNHVDLQDDSYGWRIPNIFKSTLLKLETDGHFYVSDEFSISTPLTINLGFNCADSLMLYWSPVPDALTYRIYTLEVDTFKSFAEISDTSLVIEKSKINDVYFSASAVSKEKLVGLKGTTLNYSDSRLECYIKRLLADVTNENKIILTVDLGTVLNLKKIVWQRKIRDSYVTLGETEINSKSIYQFLDENPMHGTNIYRLKIELSSGGISYSEMISATVLKDADFMIFPNPAQSIVNVLSKNLAGYDFKLVDVTGKMVLSGTIDSLAHSVDVSKLASGMYIFGIFKGLTKLYSGKLLKN